MAAGDPASKAQWQAAVLVGCPSCGPGGPQLQGAIGWVQSFQVPVQTTCQGSEVEEGCTELQLAWVG